MRKNTLWSVIIFSLIAASMPFTISRAQTEIKLSSLEVDLWPEYDRPSVLVIYRITLPPSVSLPADLTLRIPAAAGEPSAVAVRQMTAAGEAGLFSIPYKRQVAGEWGMLNITVTMPELQIEYYDPGLTKNGEARQYEYRWPGDYAVDALTLQVQQPFGASNMRISPASGPGETSNDGLVYYNEEVGSLPAGQTFNLTINYTKSTDDLSVAKLKIQPSAPVSVTPERSDLLVILPWALGGLGVALIVGGVVWYMQSGKGKREERPRRRHQPVTLKEADEAGGYIYCHQCGKRASPGDVFCRMCGAKLRTE